MLAAGKLIIKAIVHFKVMDIALSQFLDGQKGYPLKKSNFVKIHLSI